LLRLDAIEEIFERERPSLIESGDPYQVAWKAVHSGEALEIPTVGFYHSHFPEAYLRSARKFLGERATEILMDASRRYVRNLYNRFQRTIVPSPALGELLTEWGVQNVFPTDLGVDTACFHARVPGCATTRAELGVPPGGKLLLYVGRLAFEKNTQTLFAAIAELARTDASLRFLIIGDGLQRQELLEKQAALPNPAALQWIPYCGEPERLARYYRAADLFVHPGIQETFGLVTIEAQACGTPVIGIRGSYMDRIIHAGLDGWATKNSPSALAAAIRGALGACTDDSRQHLSQHIARHYAWTSVFQRLFSLYREVIARYQPV
jgi:alpha-1,6-mannosyltransferase